MLRGRFHVTGPFYGNGGVDWHSFGWMNGGEPPPPPTSTGATSEPGPSNERALQDLAKPVPGLHRKSPMSPPTISLLS